MELSFRIPHWTPCKYDPDSFDCSECEIGWTTCRLKTDESLRAFRASRSRRFADVVALSGARDYELERQAVEFLKYHGLSITPALLLQYIGSKLPDRATKADIERVLKASSHVLETTPGMFKLANTPREKWKHLKPQIVSSGSQTEVLIREANPLAQEEQITRFKKLTGLRALLPQEDGLESSRGIDATIEELSAWASSELGWSHTDIFGFAVGPDSVPRLKVDLDDPVSMTYPDNIYKLLSAVSADVWRNRISAERVTEAFVQLRDSLIAANLRLAASRAMRWAQGGFLTYSDLFQEGSIGLMVAIDRYDPFRGNQFSTYATYWIDQRIRRCKADFERIIRIPVHLHDRVRRVLAAETDNCSGFGRSLRAAEIANRLNLRVDEVLELLRHGEEVISLDALLEDSRSIAENANALTVDATNLLEEGIIAQATRKEIDRVLASLNNRESRVLRLRFGLDDQQPRTLQEIGEMFGVTRERIRQIEKNAIRKFKTRYALSNLTHDVQ